MNDDMTWCVSKECPLKDNCLRNESKRKSKGLKWTSDFYQKDNDCKFYINPEDVKHEYEKWKAMADSEKKEYIRSRFRDFEKDK